MGTLYNVLEMESISVNGRPRRRADQSAGPRRWAARHARHHRCAPGYGLAKFQAPDADEDQIDLVARVCGTFHQRQLKLGLSGTESS